MNKNANKQQRKQRYSCNDGDNNILFYKEWGLIGDSIDVHRNKKIYISYLNIVFEYNI